MTSYRGSSSQCTPAGDAAVLGAFVPVGWGPEDWGAGMRARSFTERQAEPGLRELALVLCASCLHPPPAQAPQVTFPHCLYASVPWRPLSCFGEDESGR